MRILSGVGCRPTKWSSLIWAEASTVSSPCGEAKEPREPLKSACHRDREHELDEVGTEVVVRGDRSREVPRVDRDVEDAHREELATGATADRMVATRSSAPGSRNAVLRFPRSGHERLDGVHSDVVGRASRVDLSCRCPVQQHRVAPVRHRRHGSPVPARPIRCTVLARASRRREQAGAGDRIRWLAARSASIPSTFMSISLRLLTSSLVVASPQR